MIEQNNLCKILSTKDIINTLSKEELIEVLLEVSTAQLEVINDFTSAILQDRKLESIK